MSPETARVLTLIVAGTALVLSLISLVWQVVSWKYTGAFVRVETRGKYVVYPQGAPEGFLVSLTARNVGRAPVTVTHVGFDVKGANSLLLPHMKWWQGPQTPHRLESGDMTSWNAQESGLLDAMTGSPDRADISGYIILATGKKRFQRSGIGREWIRIDRSEPNGGP